MPTPDVQAAITALAHRPLRPERQQIDLRGLHLTNAILDGANLTRAGLRGANLTRAILSSADLTGADLRGANLTGAMLGNANLTGAMLGSANLTGASLYSADLTGAMLGPARPKVPPGWIVTDPKTGELTRRPADSASSPGTAPPSS